MELQGFPERIEAFRRGDRDLLGQLYQAHAPEVELFLRRGFSFNSQGKLMRFQGFHEPFKLQEAIQECFLRAFRLNARHAYDADKPWRPYLMAIVRSQVIDQFRKQQTEQRYFVPLIQSVAGATDEAQALERLDASQPELRDPELLTLRARLRDHLTTFLQTLSPEERVILEEHMLGDLSQEQIATQLSLSRNDVRKLIREMRARLLRHLKTEGLIDSLDSQALFQALLVLLLLPGGTR